MIWYRYTLRTSSDFYLRPKQILVNSLVSWSGNLLWYGFSSSKLSTKSSGEAAEDINNNEKKTETQSSASSSTPKSVPVRTFNQWWLAEYTRLVYDQKMDSMKCKMCMEKKNGNIFALEGSKNFQRSGLERHQNCDDHKLADTCIKQANVMSNYVYEKFIKRHPAFEIMASAVAYMVSEEIPDRKFSGLLELQVCLN